jgi:hypothetical protein
MFIDLRYGDDLDGVRRDGCKGLAVGTGEICNAGNAEDLLKKLASLSARRSSDLLKILSSEFTIDDERISLERGGSSECTVSWVEGSFS